MYVGENDLRHVVIHGAAPNEPKRLTTRYLPDGEAGKQICWWAVHTNKLALLRNKVRVPEARDIWFVEVLQAVGVLTEQRCHRVHGQMSVGERQPDSIRRGEVRCE